MPLWLHHVDAASQRTATVSQPAPNGEHSSRDELITPDRSIYACIVSHSLFSPKTRVEIRIEDCFNFPLPADIRSDSDTDPLHPS